MKNNQDLHDERISRLYKLGSQSEPPDHLDREIKQAAHAETPAKKRRYVWPSLATAAVLVLSISVVLKVLQHEPIQETVLESAPTNDAALAPEVMLQESTETAVDGMDMEAAKLQRYLAKKQRTAPALAKPKKADAIELKAAPDVSSEFELQQTGPLECHGVKLPDSDSRDEWIRLYQKTMDLGQAEAASCLKQAYQTRFNQPIPMTLDK